MFDHHLAMRGTSHDRAPLAVRERMAIGPDRLPAALARLGTAASEVVIVSTCNRTEVYVWTGAAADGPALLDAFFADWFGLSRGDLDPTVQDLSGPDAVRHLFRVASGLESLVLGEPQILGQLRDALDHARAAGTAGPHLSRLVTEALRIGKRARSETGIARNRTSIAHAAVAVAARHPIGLAGRRVA
ncbi:MAG: glutamyl-tRNA reductase, partial [Chloroflexia bacterium]|nr:glutamyl-tRNA reductase [Chloroflexia bacterium]